MLSSLYRWYVLAAIGVTLVCWCRVARTDTRLIWIYLGGLGGAFFGAKIVYFLAEGWMDLNQHDAAIRLLTGKSILGALAGGYAGVELAKNVIRYPHTTGDWFALMAPMGIALGRIGCLSYGCCLGAICKPGRLALLDSCGQPRWPAVPVEIAFNLLMLIVFGLMRQRRLLATQHFHIYLMTYGIFRFGHEMVRETPHWIGPFSGYQLAALMIVLMGAVLFRKRAVERLKNARQNRVENRV